jgi:hypothetical protein
MADWPPVSCLVEPIFNNIAQIDLVSMLHPRSSNDEDIYYTYTYIKITHYQLFYVILLTYKLSTSSINLYLPYVIDPHHFA